MCFEREQVSHPKYDPKRIETKRTAGCSCGEAGKTAQVMNDERHDRRAGSDQW
jgi:hypothetical protein